jgi:polyhydroxyalkanoate synthesis regulator phasin
MSPVSGEPVADRLLKGSNIMSNEINDTKPGGRRGLTIGLAGGLLAGTAAGLVFGVPGLSSAASDVSSVAPAALVQQTEDPAAPTDAPNPGERLREALQPLVDDGTISAEQADAVAQQLVESRPERGEREFGGPGGRDGRHGGPGMFGRGVASEALTDLLGVDAQELRTQLRDGATLAEIAEAQGVDPQAVVDELVGELTERVDNAVENGRIDQAEADQKLADAEAKITDMVNNGRPERPDVDAEQPD